MASTYSTNLKIELIGTGEQAGTWGTTTNTNLGTALEQAIVGKADVAMSSTTITLSLTNTNAAQDARAIYLNLTGSPGGAAVLEVPAVEKPYIVKNGSNQQVTVKVSGQTGVAIPTGKTAIVYNNGTDVVGAIDYIPSLVLGAALPVASGGTGITSFGTGVATWLGTPSSANLKAAVTDETGSGALVFATSPTLTTPNIGTPSAGTLTNCTSLPISTGVSGLGTGVATFLGTPTSSNLKAAVTDETGSGALVFATSPTLTTPNLGTPSAATLTNATGLPIVAGTTGTLSVARGGTGVTSSTGTGNVVLSASPTLTGTVSAEGINVSSFIDLADNDILRFGSSDDMEIYHNGTDNYVDLNVGNMIVRDNTTTRFTFGRTSGDLTITGTFVGGGVSTIPQDAQNANYTLVAGDAGQHIYKSNTSAYTWTIPANASVAFATGTVVSFINGGSAGDITIAITSDTMYLAGAGTTGSRTLAPYGVATAIKVASTTWIISGVGLT